MLFKSKEDIFAYLVGIFCAFLIISNLISSRTFVLYGDIILPCAVLIFPIIYIVNDVLSEVYGFDRAKKVIFLGFFINFIAVIIYTITILLPAPEYATNTEAFNIVLSSTPRLLFASLLAYLIGSLINSKIMVSLKKYYENQLFLRCITSTFFGESCDAIIFISIAFYGTMPFYILLIMIISQAIFKTGYEIIVYPITWYIINKIKALPNYSIN